MASVGLKKRPRLEDMIGTGVSIRPSVDPWTELGDDPRVRAYRHVDPAVYMDMEMKLAASRRFLDEVRFAAMRDGVSVGHTMAASGLGGGSAVPEQEVVNHRVGCVGGDHLATALLGVCNGDALQVSKTKTGRRESATKSIVVSQLLPPVTMSASQPAPRE